MALGFNNGDNVSFEKTDGIAFLFRIGSSFISIPFHGVMGGLIPLVPLIPPDPTGGSFSESFAASFSGGK